MSKAGNRLYEFADFRLDAVSRLLSRRGLIVPLTPKAIDLLLALVEQPGQLLDKEILLNTVWPDTFVEENNLADNIFKLRRVLEDGENGPPFIETILRRGYRFVATVRAVGQPPEQVPEPAEQAVSEPLGGTRTTTFGRAGGKDWLWYGHGRTAASWNPLISWRRRVAELARPLAGHNGRAR